MEKKRKKNYNKKQTNVQRRSVQNSVISRHKHAHTEPFEVFQKKYNLLLNSLIENNTNEVSQRALKLIQQHKVLTITADSNNTTSAQPISENDKKYIHHISSQIVENAVFQPIYCKSYALVLCTLLSSSVFQHDAYQKQLIDVLISSIQELKLDTLDTMNAKGYGKWISHLYMQRILSDDVYNTFLNKCITSFKLNENPMSELMVHIFLTLSEDANMKKQWHQYVSTQVKPLWEHTHIGMRAKIRMWDIRDAYSQ
jgi:hypothetical protein